jgi:hypothetical protein
LNVSITINEDADQYGDHASIKVNQTKDERDRGEATVYLGNGKIVWQSDPQSNTPRVDNSASNAEDDLPF